ncbi:MAG: BTAD domain-containing putative transcriptional regulator, partial [Gemmatimonadales bacterium]
MPQPGAKVLALLTYLVLEPGPHSREELAGLLWGESPEPEARASLRQALKHLRDAIGDNVGGGRSVVQLTQPIQCEVRDFRKFAIEEPERALTTEIPRFLAGFSVRHAPQFDEWVSATRRELLQQYEHALGTLARKEMGQWHWRETIELAERWLKCDPLSDEATRLAVEARYLSGDRGAAIARFSEYRDVLARETGCGPSRTLINLARRIETDATPPTAGPVTDEWYARAPSFESSLIGREDEWATLMKGWQAVKRGAGR